MAQTYFVHQSDAKSNTRMLILAYILGIFVVPLVINLIAHFLPITKPDHPHTISQLQIYIYTLLICAIPVIWGSVWFHNSYSGPGQKIARAFGAENISYWRKKLDLKQLENIVKEMTFASGLQKTPQIFILEDNTINAFSAGSSLDDSIICITTGCLRFLKRDELTALIAHEFSHIINQDLRFNINLGMFVSGFGALSLIGCGLLDLVYEFIKHSHGKVGSGVMIILVTLLIGLVFTVLGFLWKFYSLIILAAVSKQREYLADATAVSYTHDDSIVRTLMKTRGNPKSSISLKNQEIFSHLFFATIKKSVFDTHPILEDRIAQAREMTFS